MANVLDDLIKIKTNKQEDDLLKLLDEIPIYEKLSADEKLADLKNSAVTRKKCPILAGFVDGSLYETTLADLAANVYLQIEGTTPLILTRTTTRTEKQRRQIGVLQAGIARVEYRDLMEYEHELMKNELTAVFIKQNKGFKTAALIIKTSDGYVMYHGSYSAGKTAETPQSIYAPLAMKGDHGMFIMNSYSVLGNNGYRFGTYRNSHTEFEVMIGPDGILYLMNGEDAAATYQIPWEDRNAMNMAKRDPYQFAEIITRMIERVV